MLDFLKPSFYDAYTICMSGPSRVGKTTLITTMLHDFEKSRSKSFGKRKKQLIVEPINDTEFRLNHKHDLILAGIKSGEFSPEAPGDSEHVIYDLRLKETDHSSIWNPKNFFHLDIKIHDFPGGWVSNKAKLAEIPYQTSDIFIVPVDAAILVEATRANERQSIHTELQIKSTSDMVKTWAQAIAVENRVGLCLFVPVKCETYYNDNIKIDNDREKAAELHSKFKEHYKDLLDHLKNSIKNVECKYFPVDTIGCCYLSDKKWEPNEHETVSLKARYSIPPQKNVWAPFGPEEIFLEILTFMAKTAEKKAGFWAKTFSKFNFVPNFVEGVEFLKFDSDSHCHYKRSQRI